MTMHILVIQETDWLRRGPHQQHHLMERLSQRGHTVTVLDYPILREHWPHEPLFVRGKEQMNAARLYPEARIRLITPGTVGLRPLARPSSVLTFRAEISRQIRAARPDVIVSYALSTGLPALQLARRHGIPYVFHVIDALHAIVPVGFLRPMAHWVERRIFGAADQVVLINAHLRDYAIRMGSAPERSVVLRTGVDLRRFTPGADGGPMRAELGIERDDFVLFFMGWLYPFSGVREVAESLQALPPEVKLLVVGNGDDYGALQEMQKDLGERLVLTGRVPYERIPSLAAAADVFLLPFHCVPATEHIVPIKLYEYMAAGKPVIASPLPGVQRDVGEGNGVIYAEAGGQALRAHAIRDKVAELGGQARAFVERYCDWGAITDEFEVLLARCAEAGS